MFDGDQFHQFIASSRTSLPIPLSFPLHGNPSLSDAFDPSYPPSLHTQPPLHGQLHHQPPPPPPPPNPPKNNIAGEKRVEKYPLITTSLALERAREMDPWSHDEILALLKIRSSMEIWHPAFTWEHVSRKLAELGYKRRADQCKEKFEEESRHFTSVNHNKNYRIFGELDEFYTADQEEEDEEARVSGGKSRDMENGNEVDQESARKNLEENSGNVAATAEEEKNQCQESEEVAKKPVKSSKKRKRMDKFEMFKGFCEAVVNKMMAQQEELHNRLIDDIVKRDDEKIKREEDWKNQEMKRIRMEIEMRSREQATAAERQATIIEFLKKFTSDDEDQSLIHRIDHLLKANNNSNSSTSNSCKTAQITRDDHVENPSSFPSQNSPSSILVINTLDHQTTTDDQTPASSSILDHSTKLDEAGDVGKRWPRDEVLALINMRCKMSSASDDGREGSKGPLWERISQGMLELGYKRSAKRCKEKWENINKYFRKTKDSSRKRSVNSRTCPYFHQLSCLYSDGTIVAPNNLPENQ